MKKITTILLISFTVALAQQTNNETDPNSTQQITDKKKQELTIAGEVVCINEEMAKLRNCKAKCNKFGHTLGFKTEEGIIWSFFHNPAGKKIMENTTLLHKTIKIRGILFHNAKIIDVKRFSVLN